MEHGSYNLTHFTSSTREIVKAAVNLYDRLVKKKFHVRRIYIGCPVIKENDIDKYAPKYEQLSLFYSQEETSTNTSVEELEEKELQKTLIKIKKKYGKNSVLKAMDFEEGGTTRERNEQIGGHKA